jgi:hypothetical protein
VAFNTSSKGLVSWKNASCRQRRLVPQGQAILRWALSTLVWMFSTQAARPMANDRVDRPQGSALPQLRLLITPAMPTPHLAVASGVASPQVCRHRCSSAPHRDLMSTTASTDGRAPAVVPPAVCLWLMDASSRSTGHVLARLSWRTRSEGFSVENNATASVMIASPIHVRLASDRRAVSGSPRRRYRARACHPAGS